MPEGHEVAAAYSCEVTVACSQSRFAHGLRSWASLAWHTHRLCLRLRSSITVSCAQSSEAGGHAPLVPQGSLSAGSPKRWRSGIHLLTLGAYPLSRGAFLPRSTLPLLIERWRPQGVGRVLPRKAIRKCRVAAGSLKSETQATPEFLRKLFISFANTSSSRRTPKRNRFYFAFGPSWV